MSKNIVTYQGWRFQNDLEKTRDFRSDCQVVWDRYIPELKVFFDSLGISLERPVSIEKDGSLCYLLFGSAESDEGYELDFFTLDEYASILVLPCPNGIQKIGVQEPCVLLELFGAERLLKK